MKLKIHVVVMTCVETLVQVSAHDGVGMPPPYTHVVDFKSEMVTVQNYS